MAKLLNGMESKYTNLLSQYKRVLIKLPDTVLINSAYVGGSDLFAFSKLYFDDAFAYSAQIGQAVDDGLSEKLFLTLYDAAKHTSMKGQVVIRALFDGATYEVTELAERLSGCNALQPALPNLFTYLSTYLTPEQQAILVDKLEGTGMLVYELTPELANISVSARVEPVDYQQLMHVPVGHSVPGGMGENAHCLIVEDAWKRDYDELPANIRANTVADGSARLIDGPLDGYGDRFHGARNLGVLLASHTFEPGNTRGSEYFSYDCKGIVPNLTIRRLVSGWVARVPTNPDVSQSASSGGYEQHPEVALLKAMVQGEKGDVILLEYQWESDHTPLECSELVFALIRAATTCLEMTVIEPAGNAQLDLDSLASFSGKDSGAILVGAFSSSLKEIAPNKKVLDLPENWTSAYNYSKQAIQEKRMCFAPMPILTIVPNQFSANNPIDESEYRGTSAATAIIAGIACMLQSIYRTHHPDQPGIRPDTLRELLCNPTNSVRNPVSGQMVEVGGVQGVVPDVHRLLQAMGMAPVSG
ncbi:hypothetical protein [Fibrella arboris]|uniref:hypothetical protein n=1 Tax=Fibrella arboris TaxID=3242486 RepID=UPI00352126D6